MKKYIKVLSVLLSSLMIFTVISCANDSVESTEPETNAEKPSDKPNKEEVNYDGTYPIEFEILNSYKGNFLLADLSKMVYLEDNLNLQPLLGSCSMTTNKVEKNYNFYEFIIPEKLKGYFTGNQNSKIPINGILITEKELSKKEKLNLIISDKGKTITTDCKEAVYFGTISDIKLNVIKYNLDFKSISLKDKNNKEYIYLSEPEKYIGTWEHKENKLLIQTITINKDATGSYNFSDTDKGETTLDYTKIGRIEVIKNSDKTTFGMLVPTKLGSLDFYETKKLPVTFIRKNPLTPISGNK